jgi:hypothetical protein
VVSAPTKQLFIIFFEVEMTKHTPGPWNVGKSNGNKMTVICLDPEQSAGTAIAFTVSRDKRSLEQCEADARLIAAAPELLEELEKYVKACDLCDGYGIIEYQPSGIDGYLPTGDANFVTEDCPRCAKASAVIAKAKGE